MIQIQSPYLIFPGAAVDPVAAGEWPPDNALPEVDAA